MREREQQHEEERATGRPERDQGSTGGGGREHAGVFGPMVRKYVTASIGQHGPSAHRTCRTQRDDANRCLIHLQAITLVGWWTASL